MSDQASLDDFDAYRDGLAENARGLGHERAEDVVTEDDWTPRAWDALVRFVELGIDFDADDLRAAAGPPPSVGAPGALIRKASTAGMIRSVGVTRSRSVSRRAGLQLRWGPA